MTGRARRFSDAISESRLKRLLASEIVRGADGEVSSCRATPDRRPSGEGRADPFASCEQEVVRS
jgi:hypothetical protein